MATYVLLHGSWHGSWCWKRVRPLLWGAGHEVYTPTYTGVGDRAHLATPDVGMSTHIQDVVAMLEAEDLHDVVLLGHSYGGVVINGVADAAPDRVGRMIYFDCSIAGNGDSVIGVMAEGSQHAVRSRTDGWMVHPSSPERLGITDPADVAWVTARLTPHPLKGFTEPVSLTGAYERVPKSFIECRPPDRTPRSGAQVAESRGWPVHVINSGHDAMITHPRELADVLLQYA